MLSLKRSSCFLGAAVVLLSGCATSSYRIANRDGQAIELEVSSNRVLLQCEYASENKEIPYGFMIHVLDEERTVLNLIQGNTLSKGDCFNRLDKIGRILKNGKRIYVAGIGDIDKPREREKWMHHFSGLGTFNSNSRGLQFFAIANEHGHCFDAYSWEEKPCPQSGIFPLKKK